MADASSGDETRPYRNRRMDGVARKRLYLWISPELYAAIESDMRRKNQTISAAGGDALAEHYGIDA